MGTSSTNPYQAPEAEVLTSNEHEERQHFYVVSIRKFTILFFMTMGMYSIYWFYKNWDNFRKYSGTEKKIWPIPRAIFSIFFAHKLLREVDGTIKKREMDHAWDPEQTAGLYVLIAVMGHVFDRMAMKEIGSPYSDLAALALLPVSYLILRNAQRAINLSQKDSEGLVNNRLTPINIFWIVLGSLLWGLSVWVYIDIFSMSAV